MSQGILVEIVILLASTVVAVAGFRRFNLPPVLAYLFVGTVIGPHGQGWITDTEDTRLLAEFGIVFLLFTLGLEFSLPKLIAIRRAILGLGGAQVVVTTLLIGLAAWLLGVSAEAALIIGGVFAMSSTAIVIKELGELKQLETEHGRLSVAVLLFQDLAIIPFLIIIPVLATGDLNHALAHELALALTKGTIVALAMVVIGKHFLRPLFDEIASFNSAELFTLTILLFSLAAAWLTHAVGLSLALGAFLAGMMLGETPFRKQAEDDIRPFRDVLMGLYFVTVGMLLDIHTLSTNIHVVLLIVLAIVLYKSLFIMGLGRLVGAKRDVALQTGLILAQGGEFGFVLLSLALGDDLLNIETAHTALAAVILSMALSPWLIRHNQALVKFICRSR